MAKEIFRVDNLQVLLYESRMLMGADAAKMAAEKVRELLTMQDELSIVFAAAPSQNEFLEALVQEPGIDWSRIIALHMDEYVGLPDDAPQRFGNFLKEKVFSKVPFRAVHYLNGNASVMQEECQRYTALLTAHAPDLVFMGIGENTHIAFNDPHVANFNDPHLVKLVNLDLACRQQQVNDGCFKKLEDVPSHALTLTVPALLKAKFIYCVVPGSTKAKAVYHTMHSEIVETYPSTILRKQPNAIMFVDKDSAVLL